MAGQPDSSPCDRAQGHPIDENIRSRALHCSAPQSPHYAHLLISASINFADSSMGALIDLQGCTELPTCCSGRLQPRHVLPRHGLAPRRYSAGATPLARASRKSCRCSSNRLACAQHAPTHCQITPAIRSTYPNSLQIYNIWNSACSAAGQHRPLPSIDGCLSL